jgi:hypothetical protein
MSGKKIAIVGFARPHRDEAPYDDPSWEIWGVNDAWSFMPRADRWFETHSRQIHEWELRRAKGHLEFLATFAGPIYMIEHYDHIPSSVEYPLADIIEDIGRVYLTSSIAYMLALAIHEKPDDIGMWGVDMASQSEYAVQRPCCEWLIGVAEGRGIKVTLPDACLLMRGKLYGRGDLNDAGEKLTTNQMQERLRDLSERQRYWESVVSDAKRRLDACEGALAEARYQTTQLVGNGPAVNHLRDRADELQEKKLRIAEQFEEAIEALQRTRGSKEELTFWIGLTPEGADPRLVGGLATLAAGSSLPSTPPPAVSDQPLPAMIHSDGWAGAPTGDGL